MNYKMVTNTIGKVLRVEAFLMLLPAIVSLVYNEWTVSAIFATVALAVLLVSSLLVYFIKPDNQYIFAKEGFVTVALAWITVSIVGALPFVISGEIPSFVDALFETVSGFTTTGASILENVEKLSHGVLFWRSFTHWIGGMGILVFIMALAPKNTDRTMHILRAEMPGPVVDKFLPKTKQTTLILYLIYTALTLVLTILLLFGGLDLFESLVYAFGTAGTGGFAVSSTGLATYSNYVQWVIAVFMLLFGVNFNLYFLIIIGKFSAIFKNTEFWVYIGIAVSSITLISINIYSVYNDFWTTVRLSFFQTSSILTTTGYSTVDFAKWPIFSQTLLLVLMFGGACAGSTAGGFKVSRLVILFKSISANLKRVLHPRTTTITKLDGKKLDEETIAGVNSYLLIYILLFAVIFLLLFIDPWINTLTSEQALTTNLSAAASCLNNIGPGLSAVGPMANYSAFSPFSKIVLTCAMLLGRLEIYPILLTFSITTWVKK